MVLNGNVDANINTVDTETSINMVDDDMNYLVMAMIKGETNISIDTETTIDMVVDVMNYLVKALIKGYTSINMVDDDMNYQVKVVINGETTSTWFVKTCSTSSRPCPRARPTSALTLRPTSAWSMTT